MKGDVVLDFMDEDSFWVPMKGKDDKTGEMKINGYVRMTINLLPKEQYFHFYYCIELI